jgi:hypothetical protein
MTSPVQNADPSADAQRQRQTALEQSASFEPVSASSIVWPNTAPPNRGDPNIPLPAANPPTGGSISPPAPPNMSIYNYFDYAFATPGGWVASPGLPPWLWPALFRTIPNRSPDEAALGSQLPHPVQAETPPSLQATTRAAPPQSEQAQYAQSAQAGQRPTPQPAPVVQRPQRPQRPTPPAPPRPTASTTARPGTSDPVHTPGQPNIPLSGGTTTTSGTAPSPMSGQRMLGGADDD